VPRHRHRCPAAPRGAGVLLAACLALAGRDAMAQSWVYPDPLAPKLETNAKKPPRFEKFERTDQVRLGPPPKFSFSPPASGAGVTGFDSTNSRKILTPKQAAKLRAKPGQVSPDAASALVLSPYQQPPPPLQDTAGTALAAAPGAPPVELGPIRRPLRKRKAGEVEDPYAPVGVRVGSFDLYPAVELIGGYDSNPGEAPNGKGAALYTVAPELRAQSDWSRHELKADLRGSYTGYSPDQEPSLSRPNFNGRIDGRIDVTRTTHVDLDTRLLVGTDNPGSPNLQAGLAKLPVFATFGGGGGVTHQFNRFELGVKGDVQRTVYQDSVLTDGTTASNEDRDYNQYTGTLRGSYELMPGVKPYVEASTDSRVHDLSSDIYGFQRDSRGVTGQVGSTFSMSQRLTGEIGIGYTQRYYADPRFDTLSGLIGNASLIWTASALTTVKLTATSTVGESTIPGVSGILYRDVTLQIDHALRRWLIASLKFGFGTDSYKGGSDTSTGSAAICNCVVTTTTDTTPDRQDLRYEVGFGLTYKLTREVQLKGEVRRDWMHSNVAGNDYTENIFLLGLRLQR
jgi:hypothetical protein